MCWESRKRKLRVALALFAVRISARALFPIHTSLARPKAAPSSFHLQNTHISNQHQGPALLDADAECYAAGTTCCGWEHRTPASHPGALATLATCYEAKRDPKICYASWKPSSTREQGEVVRIARLGRSMVKGNALNVSRCSLGRMGGLEACEWTSDGSRWQGARCNGSCACATAGQGMA